MEIIHRMYRAVFAAAAAASLVVAGLLAYEIAWRPVSPADDGPERASAAASTAPAASGNLLELSVLDQPRAVPDIHFSDEQSRDMTLADFRGRVVLLNIWATWCVPCRKEMPTLDRLQARLGGDDFQVVALSIDRGGIPPVKTFYQQLGLAKLAIYNDPSGNGSRALAIPGVPTTLLIDREGREVARKMGEAEWDSPEMVSLIQRVIQSVTPARSGR